MDRTDKKSLLNCWWCSVSLDVVDSYIGVFTSRNTSRYLLPLHVLMSVCDICSKKKLNRRRKDGILLCERAPRSHCLLMELNSSLSLLSYKLPQLKHKTTAKLKDPEFTVSLPRAVIHLFMQFYHMKEYTVSSSQVFPRDVNLLKLRHWCL